VEDAVQLALPSVEAASSTQQPEPQPAGGSKKDKERARKERQRQRKIDEAMEALDGAMTVMEETAGAKGVDAVEEAMQAAAKLASRSEPLAALVVVARTMLEQARAAESERAKLAAEEAAAAAAVKAVMEAERARVATEKAAAAAAVKAAAEAAAAAERLQLEEEVAALTLSVQSETLRLQQVQARLGVPPPAPAEETMCVVCMDAAKDRAVRPCMHVCVCETCAQLLMLERTPRCPVCREPIQHIERVFF
jgi:DNA repair exonuclease SbcCD ATPase subunit